MFKTVDTESNYLAKIVKLGKPIPHGNANRLQGWLIDYNRVWTDLSYKEGDIVVYFPIECQINPELLSYLNLFSDSGLNQDKTKKGYFNSKARVRAIKLRGEPSEGIILPIGEIMDFCLNTNEKTEWKPLPEYEHLTVDYYFDTIDIAGKENWICKKYIPANQKSSTQNQSKTKSKNKIKDMMVEGQFQLHRNTPKLKDNIHQIQPDDIISITNKLHGTSGVFSNVLVKRKVNLFEKLLLKFGVNIKTEKYGNIFSSRTVIKDVDGIKHSEGGFFDVDIWGIVNDEIKDKIQKNITLYCEVVGFLPNGKAIQKSYDYSCEPNQHKVFIYRITSTNEDGHVTEFNWQMVKDYCNKYGLEHVPELYYGKATDFGYEYFIKSGKIFQNQEFDTRFLEALSETYLEKDCTICKNVVPAEGVVVRIEKGDCPAYKLKSFRFLQKESEQLDSEELDVETEN